MPLDQRRRHEIAVAVVAHESANLKVRLPRNAARLLAAMFPTEDVCRRSIDDIATTGGFNRKTLSATLKRLVEAGFLSRETGAGSTPDIYELHVPPVRR